MYHPKAMTGTHKWLKRRNGQVNKKQGQNKKEPQSGGKRILNFLGSKVFDCQMSQINNKIRTCKGSMASTAHFDYYIPMEHTEWREWMVTMQRSSGLILIAGQVFCN